MRLLCLLGCVVFSALAHAEDPTDEKCKAFSVTGYRLAFVHVGKQGEVVNEYVPRGENLENWTKMIAVREWPNAKELKEVVGPYVRKLQPLYVRDAQVFRPEGGEVGEDLVFEFYLAPPDKSYLEYNLIRFVLEEGAEGVKSYQFAVRGEYNLEAAVKFNEPRLKSRLDTIAALTLESETEPLSTNDDSEVKESSNPEYEDEEEEDNDEDEEED